jgi:hypothetical protein
VHAFNRSSAIVSSRRHCWKSSVLAMSIWAIAALADAILPTTIKSEIAMLSVK